MTQSSSLEEKGYVVLYAEVKELQEKARRIQKEAESKEKGDIKINSRSLQEKMSALRLELTKLESQLTNQQRRCSEICGGHHKNTTQQVTCEYCGKYLR